MNTRIENKADKAKKLFLEGYNCSQSVLCAFCDETGMDFDQGLKLSSSFGGGMGRMREVCGAVSAMFMVAGIKYGYTSNSDDEKKREHYQLIQRLAEEFKEKYNTIICSELLGLDKNDNPIPSKRTQEYYDERPCDKFVADAAEIIQNLINNKNNTEVKNENSSSR